MRQLIPAACAVVLSCGICLGWSWWSQPQAALAVVDLDQIAQKLGRDKEILGKIQKQTENLQAQFSAIEKNAAAQLEQARKGLGDSPSPEQAGKFRQQLQQAQFQLNQLKDQADRQLLQYRQKLISQSREDIRPFAVEVAHERGFDVVVTRNDAFLYSFDSAVNITDSVAERMAASPAFSKTAPAAQPANAKPVANSTASAPPAAKSAAIQQTSFEKTAATPAAPTK